MIFTALSIALVLPAVIGGSLAWLGWRGRRDDDHPICRRCGIDLVRLPEGTKTCSECGADLTAARAIRIGHYRRRGGLLWSGAALCALTLAIVGGGVWATLAGLDLNPYKPLWMLRGDARSMSGAVSNAAL